MMIKIILTSFLFCFSVTIFSGPLQIQTNKKVFLIHKSKRAFIEKKDRPYIKKKEAERKTHENSGAGNWSGACLCMLDGCRPAVAVHWNLADIGR